MKTFLEMSRDLDTQNVNKAIQHDWATHIKHPSLGEDFVKVVDHSLTEDGVIEEYYVTHAGTLLTIQATEVTEAHGGSHSHESKSKKKKKWKHTKNSMKVGFPKKKKKIQIKNQNLENWDQNIKILSKNEKRNIGVRGLNKWKHLKKCLEI